MQEFWTESIELFFEKPAALKTGYPQVFEALKWLLNQDPLRPECPLLQTNLSLKEKMKRIFA